MIHEFLNVDKDIYDTHTNLSADTAGLRGASAAEWSVSMRRLRGGLSDGVEVLTVDNGRLKLEILPTRGMGIWRGTVDGVPVQWNSPVERPVHPAYVDQMRRGGIGWLDGFNELICRCGLGWHGAPGTDVIRDTAGNVVSEQFLPLHGRIANLAAHQVSVEVDGGRITVTGVVDESSVFGGRLRMTSKLSTVIGSSQFAVTDIVSNLGSSPAEVEMLYHCNVGEPFLGEGSVFHSASSEVAPRDARAAEGISMWNLFQGPTTGYAEQVYFTAPSADELGYGIGLLTDADAQLAFCVRFDLTTLPWLVLWKNTQAAADGYCAGLEPGSSFPNLRTTERTNGRVISLPPGHETTFRLSFEIATERQRVRQLIDQVTERQVATPRTVHASPRDGWSG